MEIVSINPKTIQQAIRLLKQGKSIVFPTETAYGLAADATDKMAMRKIFKIKKRSPEKSLPWIAADLAMAKKYARFSPLALRLAKKYWPGPLTIVLPAKKQKGTIALRVSSNKIARALSSGLGRPIVSTSANLSGLAACYSASSAAEQFKNQKFQPDLVLNSGRLKKRKPSTIVKIVKNKIILIRSGAIEI